MKPRDEAYSVRAAPSVITPAFERVNRSVTVLRSVLSAPKISTTRSSSQPSMSAAAPAPMTASSEPSVPANTITAGNSPSRA